MKSVALILLLSLTLLAAPPVPVTPTYTLRRLAWDYPFTNQVTFTVLVGTNSRVYNRWFSVGTNLTAVVTGLSPAQEPYYFAVMAVSGTNNLPPSDEVVWPWPATNSYYAQPQFSSTFNGAKSDIPPGQWHTPQTPAGYYSLRLIQTNNVSEHETLE